MSTPQRPLLLSTYMAVQDRDFPMELSLHLRRLTMTYTYINEHRVWTLAKKLERSAACLNTFGHLAFLSCLRNFIKIFTTIELKMHNQFKDKSP